MKHSTAVQFVESEIAIIHQKQVDGCQSYVNRLLRLKMEYFKDYFSTIYLHHVGYKYETSTIIRIHSVFSLFYPTGLEALDE